ncbi:MAG: hypothetical protein HN341_12915 [Verrucomicrobia bacterium]|nr:hypothetical protein [Verrucomicrobiota bacterium]
MPARFPRTRAFFMENRVTKLLALLLAIMTVYAIQRITNQLEDFEIPIVVEVDDGVAVLRQDAKTAYITCRGSLDDLRRLDIRQLRCVVSPKETGVAGGERVPIGPRNVQGWSRGVQIIKVSPDVVVVDFDREIEKLVGVAKPETVGKPLLGKAEVDYDPKIVRIRGPLSKLEDRNILRTEPINVEDAVDSFTKRVKVLSEGESDVWEIEPAEVTVRVSIVTKAINKEWKQIPVLAVVSTECGRNFKFSPEVVDVSLLGSPQAVTRVKDSDISVFVDCVGIATNGVFKMAASVHLPPGINVSAAVEPPLIEVTVNPISATPNATQQDTPTETPKVAPTLETENDQPQD